MPRTAIAATLTALAAAVVLLALYFVTLASAGPAGLVLDVDKTDDDPAASDCMDAVLGDCSLRGAISKANATPGADHINVPNGTYTLTVAGANEDANATGDLDITEDLTIDGGFTPMTIVEGGTTAASAVDRVFHVLPGASFELQQVTVRNGQPPAFGSGGGILSQGPLIIRLSAITGNEADEGGGIALVGNAASIEMYSTTVANNVAATGGGGVYKTDGSGQFYIENSDVVMNQAQSGGGLFIGLSSSVNVIDTTVSNNQAVDSACIPDCFSDGGGIYVPADLLEITGGTVSGNTSQYGPGGGIYASRIAMQNTDVIGNTADGGGYGGGIWAISQADITASLIDNNHASSFGGGIAIFDDGNIIDTTISNNTSDSSGGGVASQLQTSVSRSVIAGNSAAVSGGGFLLQGGTASLENTTVSGNSATVRGGGVARGPLVIPGALPAGNPVPGAVQMSYVTIADNSAPSGSAVSDEFTTPTFAVESSIIALNNGSANCNATLDSGDHNIEDQDTCGLNQPFDQTNTDPLLSPLADNGGFTDTHALQALSPAVDAADPNCPPPNLDQRGSTRPVGNGCDVGAYESAFAAATPTLPASATPTSSATPVATPTPTPTPSPSPTTTPSGSPEPDGFWGDDDCNQTVAATDALKKLQDIASLPYEVEPGCPTLGAQTGIILAGAFGDLTWGDTDCDEDVDAVDALQILRHLAALPVNQEGICPQIGVPILID